MSYSAQLDKNQIECGNLDIEKSDADKTLHFVEQMYELDLFTIKFMNDWEDAPPTSYALTVTHVSVE